MKGPGVVALGVALAWVQLGSHARAAAVKAPAGPATVKSCSDAEKGEWEFVRDEQMGIQARALGGANWVGLTAATDGFHDWAPLDDFKTTICGQLARFDTFEPNREKKLLQFLPEIPEHDWNIILIPVRPSIFDERFKVATRLMDRGHEGDLYTCSDSGTPCFEAEITPHRELLKANTAGRWLSACRLGQVVCVYGAWVGDGGHGYRPEIHPAERIWWRDDDGIKLLFVQDASQRFGDRRQFQWRWGQREPGTWHPWAQPGLEGEFRVAFQADKGSTVPIRVDQLLDANTRNLERRTHSESLSFGFEAAGAAVTTVKVALGLGSRSDRLQLDLAKLDVAPEDVCDRGDGTLQGYLSIHDKAGYRYQEGEGFDAFEVSPGIPPGPPRCPPEPDGTTGEPASESLHASVRISVQEEDTGEPPAASVPRILQDLLRAATEKPPGGPEAEVAQRADVLQKMTAAPGIRVGFARRFRIGAGPHYDGPRGERMESAISHGRADDLKRLLAAANAPLPEKVEWETEVWDVAADARLPSDRMTLRCEKRLLRDDECVLELPGSGGPPETVLRVVARAQLLDGAGKPIPKLTVVGRAAGTGASPAGDLCPGEVRLASHFIRASKSDSAAKVFSWLGTAVPTGRDLVGALKSQDEVRPDANDLRPYRREYYARMLRHGVVLATADGRITLDELRQFISMAHDFGELPELCRVRQPATVK